MKRIIPLFLLSIMLLAGCIAGEQPAAQKPRQSQASSSAPLPPGAETINPAATKETPPMLFFLRNGNKYNILDQNWQTVATDIIKCLYFKDSSDDIAAISAGKMVDGLMVYALYSIDGSKKTDFIYNMALLGNSCDYIAVGKYIGKTQDQQEIDQNMDPWVYGLFDIKDFREVLPCEYKDISVIDNRSLFIKDNSGSRIADTSGKTLFDLPPDAIYFDWSEQKGWPAPISRNAILSCGLVERDGKVILDYQYGSIYRNAAGHFIARNERFDVDEVYDKEGKLLFSASVVMLTQGFYYIENGHDDHRLLTLDFNEVVGKTDKMIGVIGEENGLIILTDINNGQTSYMNAQGKTFPMPEGYSNAIYMQGLGYLLSSDDEGTPKILMDKDFNIIDADCPYDYSWKYGDYIVATVPETGFCILSNEFKPLASGFAYISETGDPDIFYAETGSTHGFIDANDEWLYKESLFTELMD